MTVPVQTPYNAYTYAGSASFVYSFQILQATDLQVSVAGIIQPASNYTVSGVGVQTGGSISYSGALTTGQLVELQRVTVLARTNDYQDEGDFLADTINADYDRLWMALQEQQRSEVQAIRVPEGSGVPVLPAAAARANTFLGFDLNGALVLVAAAIGSAAALALQYAGSAGASLIGWIQAGTGAVLRTVQSKLRERLSVVDFGADPTGVADSTAACNAAHVAAGIGGTVFYPRGTYRINGTISMLAGQIVSGDGWSTVTNSFLVASGTELRQYSMSDIPLLQIVGADNNNQKERWTVNNIALTSNTAASTVGTGFYAAYARQGRMNNVYIAGFNTSTNFDPQCWQMHLDGVRCMDFAVGMINNSSTEDNLYTNCAWQGFRTGAVGVSLVNQSANNLFLNCYLQACQIGCSEQQGDPSGTGASPGFPMFSTWISPLVEDITQFAFGMITPSQTSPSSTHPGIKVINPRVLNTGLSGYGSVNTPSTSASGTGTTATVGIATQPIAPLVGTVVTMTGMVPATYNGSFTITASTTSSVSFASTATGSQTSAGTVIFGTTQYNSAPNNGQSIIYATHCSQITLDQPTEGGFSYGVLAGVSAYGFFPSGTLPGPIDIRNVNGYVFGTAAAGGKLGSVTISPGDVQQVRLGTVQTSISLTASFGNPTFDQPTANVWGWGVTASSSIVPTRNQTVRFFGEITVAATVSGAQYLLQLVKVGTGPIATLAGTTANGTGPIVLSGEWRDIPNGSTDAYKLQIFCNSGSSVTITPASCVFGAELVGS